MTKSETNPTDIADQRTQTGESRAFAGQLTASASRWLMLIAVAIGVMCRVAQYAADQSYWGDEASLVLNIRGMTARQLLGPLDYAQAAPPLFLLAERGLFLAFGGGEMALRALPFACGMTALLLFAVLARRILTPPWDAVAVLCFAMADRLIYHDTEVKPYICDVFFCVLLLLLAVEGRRPRPAERRLAWIAMVTCVAVWFSFPCVIVFGALSLAIMPEMIRRGVRGFLQYVLLNLPVVASFGALLFVTRSTQKSTILVDYWQDAFINLHRPLALPWWLVRHFVALSDYALPATGPVVFIGAMVGVIALFQSRGWRASISGAVGTVRGADPTRLDAVPDVADTASHPISLDHETRRRSRKIDPVVWFLVGPILMALVPAALHRYPFDGARLTVYLTPCVLLLAVFGFKAIYEALFSRVGNIGLSPVAFVVAVNVFWCGYHLVVPRTRGHLRPIARFLQDRARPGETIYVFDRQAFRCYWPPEDPRLREILDRADEIPTRRFWIVWQFASEHGRVKPEPTLKWAREFCRQGEVKYGTGGAAFFFEREGDKMPARLDPPFGGVEVTQSHKRSIGVLKETR